MIRNRRGATAVEYALIAAGIAGAIVVALFAVGGDLQAVWQRIADTFRGLMS